MLAKISPYMDTTAQVPDTTEQETQFLWYGVFVFMDKHLDS